MQERITELEMRLAHLDQAMSELSDVVYDQQKQINALDRTCEELRQRMKAAAEAPGQIENIDEKPPHY